jgi:hypothetical protein
VNLRLAEAGAFCASLFAPRISSCRCGLRSSADIEELPKNIKTRGAVRQTSANTHAAVHPTRANSTGKRKTTSTLSKKRAHGGTGRSNSHASPAPMGGGAALIRSRAGHGHQAADRGGCDGQEDARTRAAQLLRDTARPSLVAKLVGHPGPAAAVGAEMSQIEDGAGGQDGDGSIGGASRAAKLRLAKLQRGSLWAQGSLSTVGCLVAVMRGDAKVEGRGKMRSRLTMGC